MTHAAIGANPQIAALILQQRARAEVCQPIAHLVTDDPRLPVLPDNVIQALVRSHPHAAIAVLRSWRAQSCSSTRRAWSDESCLALRNPVDAVPIGSHPQCAGAVAIDVAHMNASDPRQPFRRHRRRFPSETEVWIRSRSCRRGPDRWFRNPSRWPWATE